MSKIIFDRRDLDHDLLVDQAETIGGLLDAADSNQFLDSPTRQEHLEGVWELLHSILDQLEEA